MASTSRWANRAPDLRIVADDLTGALDTAAAFAGAVPVYFDQPPAGAGAAPQGPARVQAVATATRDIPADQLPLALAPALAWLAGGDIAFKKVDSLLRGNSFVEVALAARAGGFERLVLAPAFPLQGRRVQGGRLVVAGTAAPWVLPLAQALGQALAKVPVGASGDAGLVVDVPDTASDADLADLARAVHDPASRRWLWCGSAGLAHALAEQLALAQAGGESGSRRGGDISQPGVPMRPAARPWQVLLVSASHHPASREQWRRLQAAHPDACVVRHGDQGGLQAAMEATQRLVLLDLAPDVPMQAGEAAALLSRQLGMIAARQGRPGVLAVVGGDTLRGLCHATGAQGLLADGSARPGWGQASWLGGAWAGVVCHSRSGAFGDPDDLVALVALLQAAAAEG